MNAKKCKALRKTARRIGTPANPKITTRFVLSKTVPGGGYDCVNPIRYPEDSQRRIYQDSKRSSASL